MKLQATPVRAAILGAALAASSAFALDSANITASAVRELRSLGIVLESHIVRDMVDNLCKGVAMDGEAVAMDDLQAPITTAAITTPLQFLQAWLPGFVRIITAARKIDEILGIQSVGDFEDEEVIACYLELVGQAELYGDLTNVPLASWNENWERRSILRFEKGFMVGNLEALRAAKIRIDTAAEKRNAATNSLEITRNNIGFFGYNGGANRTYGFLNDPSSPAYVTAPNTGSGSSTLWANKTFLNITADLRAMMARLRTASGDNWDPQKNASTLVVATSVVDYLTVTSDFGNSVMQWLKETYPKVRVVSAPELVAANGGANVAILFADRIEDGSSDGGATWAHMVPAKYRAIGSEKRVKGYVEDFGMATAGALLKRAPLVQRLTGI